MNIGYASVNNVQNASTHTETHTNAPGAPLPFLPTRSDSSLMLSRPIITIQSSVCYVQWRGAPCQRHLAAAAAANQSQPGCDFSFSFQKNKTKQENRFKIFTIQRNKKTIRPFFFFFFPNFFSFCYGNWKSKSVDNNINNKLPSWNDLISAMTVPQFNQLMPVNELHKLAIKSVSKLEQSNQNPNNKTKYQINYLKKKKLRPIRSIQYQQKTSQ